MQLVIAKKSCIRFQSEYDTNDDTVDSHVKTPEICLFLI